MRRTVSSSVALPSCVAEMSSRTISSAPAVLWACGQFSRIAGIAKIDKLDPLHDAAADSHRDRR